MMRKKYVLSLENDANTCVTAAQTHGYFNHRDIFKIKFGLNKTGGKGQAAAVGEVKAAFWILFPDLSVRLKF